MPAPNFEGSDPFFGDRYRMKAYSLFRKRPTPAAARGDGPVGWPLIGFIGLLVTAILATNLGVAADPSAILDDGVRIERPAAPGGDVTGTDGIALVAELATGPADFVQSSAVSSPLPEPILKSFLVPLGNGPPPVA